MENHELCENFISLLNFRFVSVSFVLTWERAMHFSNVTFHGLQLENSLIGRKPGAAPEKPQKLKKKKSKKSRPSSALSGYGNSDSSFSHQGFQRIITIC